MNTEKCYCSQEGSHTHFIPEILQISPETSLIIINHMDCTVIQYKNSEYPSATLDKNFFSEHCNSVEGRETYSIYRIVQNSLPNYFTFLLHVLNFKKLFLFAYEFLQVHNDNNFLFRTDKHCPLPQWKFRN